MQFQYSACRSSTKATEHVIQTTGLCKRFVYKVIKGTNLHKTEKAQQYKNLTDVVRLPATKIFHGPMTRTGVFILYFV